MTHELKTWPEFYNKIEDGSKRFELRKHDRPCSTGDVVILKEYNPASSQYTGKERKFKIGYILFDGVNFGLKEGFCIFSLEDYWAI